MLTSLLLLGATACTGNGGESAAPTGPGARTGAVETTAPASPAPECVTGRWRVTGVNATGGFGGASGSVSGGSGATMNVAADGVTEVSFTGSQPLDFSVQVAGADVRGQVAYNGSLRGAVAFGSASADGTGQWRPQGEVNVADLRGTVRLTEPVSVTLLDNANIANFTPGQQTQAGGAVDLQPVLRGGTYTCAEGSLKVETRENGPTLVWTFTRA